jgi:glutaredoxin
LNKGKKCRCPGGSFLISGVLFILLVISIFTNGFGLISSGSADSLVVEQAVSFINEQLLTPGSTAVLKEIDSKNKIDVTRFTIEIEGKTYDSFVSRQGEYLFPDVIKMAEALSSLEKQEMEVAEIPEIPKSERPQVEAFVMSYCPYGLQAQKALLPVYQLLKEKADIKIHFVDYIMHGLEEIEENLNQYCLQSMDANQYMDYLNCFAEDGDKESCLSSVGANLSEIESCKNQLDQEYNIMADYENQETWLQGRYPLFSVEKDLNEMYDVGGSPTIVINGQKVSISPRSPENYKAFLCQAFNSQPEECATTLSNEVPVPSFGNGTTSGDSDGSC